MSSKTTWNGFGSLDLSKVEQQEGRGTNRLAVGNYTVKCTSAVMETFGAKENKRVVADFLDEAGSGDIRFNFNLHHSNPETVDIGMRQLKTFLIAGNHPTPDSPDDVASLVGLTCDIYVGMGKPWTDTNNQTRQQTEIKSFKPLSGATSNSEPSKKLDDEIPF